MECFGFIWDHEDDPDGNVRHILDGHDVTLEEVEEVLKGDDNRTEISHSSEWLVTFGHTSLGREVAVVWEKVEDNPRVVYPVTAYVPEPKFEKQKRKRKHGPRSNR